MSALVALELGEVAHLELVNPPLNLVTAELIGQLHAALERLAVSSEVRVVVVSGRGDRAFCAGSNVGEFETQRGPAGRTRLALEQRVWTELAQLPMPAIAAIEGNALGGGLELALGADLRYLAEDAMVGQPEIRLGVFPGAGGTQRLTRLAGTGRARDLVYSGRQMAADEARAVGIAERVFPAAEVFDTAVADARALAHGPREALAAAKAALRAAVDTPGAAGIARERELFVALFGGADQREGMGAFLEKRDPRFGL